MFPESVLTMTIIDLFVIVMALLTFKFASADGFFRRSSRGRVLSLMGISAMTSFYAADLLVLHVSPALIGEARAMQLLTFLRLQVLWLVTVISVCLVVIGLQLTNRARVRE